MVVLCYISRYAAKKAYRIKKFEECLLFMSEDKIELEIGE